MHKYLFIVRHGRKWHALAGITYDTPTTCAARAMADLRAAGVDISRGVVRYAATVTAQRNYAGQHPNYKEYQA